MAMPDETQEAQTETATEEAQDFEALYRQAQEDLKQAQADADKWKKMSRQNEDRAKANYGAAHDLADATEQLTELTRRLEAIEDENATLKAAAARAELVKQVAGATGVPEAIVSTLAATDEESLTAAATAIAEAFKPKGGAPRTPEGGVFPRGELAKDTSQVFSDLVDQMLGR